MRSTPWGYGKLHEELEKTAHTEMHHAEALIGRIIFLEGQPVVNKLAPIKIGQKVQGIVANDYQGEVAAVKAYNEVMRLAVEIGDNATRDGASADTKAARQHPCCEPDDCRQSEVYKPSMATNGSDNGLGNLAGPPT